MSQIAHPDESISPGEEELAARFVEFMKASTLRRQPAGMRRRFNQGRATACVDAHFDVLPDLPPELRVGLFAAPRTYGATIRFANASSQSDREPDIRGMSIRLFHVAGENLTAGVTDQDFVLNSHPVMMAPDTRGFLELLQANEAGGFRRAMYFLTHPRALRAASAARNNPTCHLDLSYWSATPYLFGRGRAVKYIARPASPRRSPKPETLTDTYLQDAMRVRLEECDTTFDFMVQFHVDRRRTPIEDASVEWLPKVSPYVRVARIRIPCQAVGDPAREALGEQMAFSPWHCLADHRPLGGMNRARRDIYEAMARFRAQALA